VPFAIEVKYEAGDPQDENQTRMELENPGNPEDHSNPLLEAALTMVRQTVGDRSFKRIVITKT
jgi:hypothetical protein